MTTSNGGGLRRSRIRTSKTRRALSLWIGGSLVVIIVLLTLLAPIITSYSPIQPDALAAVQGATPAHWLGTDSLGRDILTRVLYGGRYALEVSTPAAVMAVSIGTVLGCLSAYGRGLFDEILMRLLDAVLSVPAILALLVVVTVLGAGGPVVVLAAVVIYTPAVIRVIRAATLSVVGLDYVTAARARGEGFWPILRREIWPNILDVVFVELAMRMSWIVLLVSSLSFLGFGANPPTPDWGLMVAENRSLISVVPIATIAPIAALAILIVGLNLAADGFAKSRGVDRVVGGSR